MFGNSRFVTIERQSSGRTALAWPIRVSISLFRLPSLVNTTPRYLNLSSCCSAKPLACNVRCLGFLERHTTSFLTANFHSGSVTRSRKPTECILKNLLRGCKQYQSVRKKQTVQLPTVILSSTRLLLSIQFKSTMKTHPCRCPIQTRGGCDVTDLTDTNFWAGRQCLDAHQQATLKIVIPQDCLKLFSRHLVVCFPEVGKTCVGIFCIFPRSLENRL